MKKKKEDWEHLIDLFVCSAVPPSLLLTSLHQQKTISDKREFLHLVLGLLIFILQSFTLHCLFPSSRYLSDDKKIDWRERVDCSQPASQSAGPGLLKAMIKIFFFYINFWWAWTLARCPTSLPCDLFNGAWRIICLLNITKYDTFSWLHPEKWAIIEIILYKTWKIPDNLTTTTLARCK